MSLFCSSVGEASFFGVPLYLDEATTNGARLSYARIFVEFSASKPPPKFIYPQLEEDKEQDSPIARSVSFGHLTCQSPAKEKWVPKNTTVAELIMDSNGGINDKKIEIETSDTHKTSGKNREDTTNTDQSLQNKHPSATLKDIKSKGTCSQDEEMPYIQTNKGKCSHR